jgi:hypothetical protein
MTYTVLRLTKEGVVLGAYHLRRLGLVAGTPAHEAFVRLMSEPAPGVWAVQVDGDVVTMDERGESRLTEGLATRFAVSPVAEKRGGQPKPGPGGVYDSVREPGVATLLTTANGRQILEACVAAVVGWDGERIVCVPESRPRVWSCADQAIREHLKPREAPLRVDSTEPLLLVNAVKGTCAVAAPGRQPFPAEARATIDRLLARLCVPARRAARFTT